MLYHIVIIILLGIMPKKPRTFAYISSRVTLMRRDKYTAIADENKNIKSDDFCRTPGYTHTHTISTVVVLDANFRSPRLVARVVDARRVCNDVQ